MLLPLSVIGIMLLFSCLVFAHICCQLTWEKNETGLAFTIQAFTCLNPERRFLQYHYENPELEIIPAIARGAAWAGRRGSRAGHHDMKEALLRLVWHDYHPIIMLFNYARIEKINWESRIGLQEAMYTGILTGVLWAIKGSLSSMLSMNWPLEELRLKVEPVYDQEIFSSHLDCIIKIRIVHIIFIAVYRAFMTVRGYINGYRAGKTESSHRGTYENSYAKY